MTEKRITLVYTGTGTARADARLMERVLQNLIDNAVKFTPESGRVEIAIVEADGAVEVRVQDTGPGLGSPVPASSKGSGLGLNFCREAVKAMGGELRSRSAPGEGALFTVHLPAGGEAGRSVA